MNKFGLGLLTAAAVLVSACGGGGGGGGSTPPATSTYTGTTTQATLDTSSAVSLSSAVLSNATDNKELDDLSKTIDLSVETALGSAGKAGLLAGAVGDSYLGCNGSGSMTVTASSGVAGQDYTYTVSFTNFLEYTETQGTCGDNVVNGVFSMHLLSTPTESSFDYTFQNLQVSTAGIVWAKVNGSMGMTWASDASFSYTMDLEAWARDLLAGTTEQFKVAGYSAQFNSNWQLVSIAGTFYDETDGYVTLSTNAPGFTYACTYSTVPVSGTMVVTDSVGAWEVTYSSNLMTVTGPGGTDTAATDSSSACGL